MATNLKISVSDTDISAIKAMTDDQRGRLRDAINATDPFSVFEVNPHNRAEIICPFCGNGRGENHTGIKPTFNGVKWLFSCKKGVCNFQGDLISVIAEANNLDTKRDFWEILAIGAAITGQNISGDFSNYDKAKNPATHATRGQNTPLPNSNDKSIEDKKSPKIVKFERLEESQLNMKSFIESQGGFWRCLSDALLNRLKWGFLPDIYFPDAQKKLPAVIIPNDKGGIFARAVEGKHYRNNTPTATTTIFLPDAEKFDCVVVEGAINGASILQAIPTPNFAIIASGGTSGNQNVLERLQELHPKINRLLIAYDNDTSHAGQDAAAKLLEMATGAGFTAVSIDITRTADLDLNKMLKTQGENALAEMIKSAISGAELEFEKIKQEKAAKLRQELFGSSISEILPVKFESFVATNKKFVGRKTGFSNLDSELKNFLPGVYLVGGLAALGKTTFCLQLLEQMARRGENCIFCSYEMAAGFLYSKILAREVSKIETKNFNARVGDKPLTATEISLGIISGYEETYQAAVKNLTAENISLFVWEFDRVDVDNLITRLDKICANLEKPPIVCIDYLQLLAIGAESPKVALDKVLHKIFTFRRKTNTTFIIVSSLNRANYNTEISFESFKESGGIEFSADAIFGLQLLVEGERNREAVEKAKKEIPRKIQLKCLKNRFGANFDCGFFYFPHVDLFKPMEEYEYAEFTGNYTDYTQNSDGNLVEVRSSSNSSNNRKNGKR